MKFLAGFECGYLDWCKQDLLVTTDHMPESRMSEHYRLALENNFTSARDGLTIGHNVDKRLEVASRFKFYEIWWDLHHWRPVIADELHAHAKNVVKSIKSNFIVANERFYYCAVNEPHQYPDQAKQTVDHAVELAFATHDVIRNEISDVLSLTTDPFTGDNEQEYYATDKQVAKNYADVIGVNCYPHSLKRDISEILVNTYKRYNLPVMLSETSWHDGHPEHHANYPEFTNKGDWLAYVLKETEKARNSGVDIVGACWCPFVDTPHWGEPDFERWSHGLINKDLQTDKSLAKIAKEYAI